MSRVLLPSLVLLALALPVRAEPAAPVRGDLAALVQGNNTFALDLYARLRQDRENAGKNLFCSPYSISAALAMTWGGARGETAEEMARVLHFTLDGKRLHPAFAELTRELNGHGLPRDYQLQVAHSLWGHQTTPFLSEFQDLIRASYGCRLRPVDFQGDPEGARRTINRWVEERTNDRIKELLQRPDITPLTVLVLVNAIYFKAAWKEPFNPKASDTGVPFQTASGEKQAVTLMRQTGRHRYLEAEGVQALELPYEGDELSLVVLLPQARDGLAGLEEKLSPDRLSGWLGGLQPAKVDVGLPRFRIASRFVLNKVLEGMGMPRAFDSRADFSGITPIKVFISRVIHQAFVDVNEEGTEAAAATAVVLSRPDDGGKPVSFRADHPFLFLVRDTRTGSILFLGRVTEPRGESD